MKKKFCALMGALGLSAYVYWQNTQTKVTEYLIESPRYAGRLHGMKIAVLSDLNEPHNFIEKGPILKKLRQAAPDLILLTGNMLSEEEAYNPGEMNTFALGLVQIAPTYAIMGPNEVRNPRTRQFEALWQRAGVHFLHDEAVSFNYKGENITLMGLEEKTRKRFLKADPLKAIQLTKRQENQVKLLIAHHPEAFLRYHDDMQHSPDLVVCGHAQGGGVNIPGFGGLYAPSQGYKPAYTDGVYRLPGNAFKRMAISRGLGQPKTRLRFNNPAEILCLTLTDKTPGQ